MPIYWALKSVAASATVAVITSVAGPRLCVPTLAGSDIRGHSQQPAERFRASTELVSVDVLVLQNLKGTAIDTARYLSALRRSDVSHRDEVSVPDAAESPCRPSKPRADRVRN